MKVLAFAASSSRESINKKLVTYAASLLDGVEVEVLDLNDYEMPLFSVDKEKELGQPDLAKAFLAKIGESDAIIISFAEHNGSYSAAYKNLFDWCSRITVKVYQGKPMVMLSTSPGGRGARACCRTPLMPPRISTEMSRPAYQYRSFMRILVSKNLELQTMTFRRNWNLRFGA